MRQQSLSVIIILFCFCLLDGMELKKSSCSNIEKKLEWFQRDASYLIEDGFGSLVANADKARAIQNIQYRTESMIKYIQEYDSEGKQHRIGILDGIKKDVETVGAAIKQLQELHSEAIAEQNEEKKAKFFHDSLYYQTLLTDWEGDIISINRATTKRVQQKMSYPEEDLLASTVHVAQELANLKKEKEGNKEVIVWSDKIKECIAYTENQKWSTEIKIYVLQLLFWNAHINKNDADKIALGKSLRKLKASFPTITHNYQEKPFPQFLHDIQILPDNAPEELKILFNTFKKEEKEIASINPYLKLEGYYNKVQKQKRLLQRLSSYTTTSFETIKGVANRISEKIFEYIPSSVKKNWEQRAEKQEEENERKNQIDIDSMRKKAGKSANLRTLQLTPAEKKARKEDRLKMAEKRRVIEEDIKKTPEIQRLINQINKSIECDQNIIDQTIINLLPTAIALPYSDENVEKIRKFQKYASIENQALQAQLKTIENDLQSKHTRERPPLPPRKTNIRKVCFILTPKEQQYEDDLIFAISDLRLGLEELQVHSRAKRMKNELLTLCEISVEESLFKPASFSQTAQSMIKAIINIGNLILEQEEIWQVKKTEKKLSIQIKNYLADHLYYIELIAEHPLLQKLTNNDPNQQLPCDQWHTLIGENKKKFENACEIIHKYVSKFPIVSEVPELQKLEINGNELNENPQQFLTHSIQEPITEEDDSIELENNLQLSIIQPTIKQEIQIFLDRLNKEILPKEMGKSDANNTPQVSLEQLKIEQEASNQSNINSINQALPELPLLNEDQKKPEEKIVSNPEPLLQEVVSDQISSLFPINEKQDKDSPVKEKPKEIKGLFNWLPDLTDIAAKILNIIISPLKWLFGWQ